MQGRYGNLDYSRLTKLSFLLGIGMFVVGEFGEFGIRKAGMSVPAWEHSLLMTMAAIGIVVALLSPFVFGIVLPLTE
ncbi:hypothetical protein [Halobaculum magnesiiphilum]|uniref:Uncharacterized protein n=1 Tax=Halobaculum magnesiiphilum TaxID=1017351 RepID=A0A8T8WHQ4_9EURY|nr:hypothetical protein [Halobaculum magnesiiphilum]QZP39264.1 hypothetical protein K6T50_16555 [Halobaculum magnesiiphilum]